MAPTPAPCTLANTLLHVGVVVGGAITSYVIRQVHKGYEMDGCILVGAVNLSAALRTNGS